MNNENIYVTNNNQGETTGVKSNKKSIEDRFPMNTDRLISLLEKLEKDDSIKYEEDLTVGYIHDKCKLIQDIVIEAEYVLLSNDGTVNRPMTSDLERKGYDVYPGETDSFGWLTGCIETKKGTIVFG